MLGDTVHSSQQVLLEILSAIPKKNSYFGPLHPALLRTVFGLVVFCGLIVMQILNFQRIPATAREVLLKLNLHDVAFEFVGVTEVVILKVVMQGDNGAFFCMAYVQSIVEIVFAFATRTPFLFRSLPTFDLPLVYDGWLD